MNTIVCKNVFVSNDEVERSKKFNEIWQMIVNLILNQ